MDSDNSESDNDQNNHNRQFNTTQTEAVVKCLFEVLKTIIKASKKDKKRQEIQKPTKKGQAKLKIKKNKVVDVGTHIQVLCDTFKNIASTSSQAKVSTPSAAISSQGEAIPGTSRQIEEASGSSGPSRHNEAAISVNSTPNIKIAPETVKHGTDKVVPSTSGTKKLSNDIHKNTLVSKTIDSPRHTEIVVINIPSSFKNALPETSKSQHETISKKHPDNFVTETSASLIKPVEETSKSRTESRNSVQCQNHTECMVSETTRTHTAHSETAASCSAAQTKTSSENSELSSATKTVINEMPGASRMIHSNTKLHMVSIRKVVTESTEDNSLNRHDEISPTEGSSQTSAKNKVVTMESEEINNNVAATKRNHINSIVDDLNRATIDHTCTLCLKSISNEEFAKHYKDQHGIHHEIQHNNRNFENKIQDLDKRLHNTSKNKTNSERKDKITFNSNKRTAARSSSAPNADIEQTNANPNLDIIADEAKEPDCKKKRTSTRSDSAPNVHIEPTSSASLKEENTHSSVDTIVIDLTEDIDLNEPKPSANIRMSKPGDDDQILNDCQFTDPSDDTSLYETRSNETKIAEAILLNNVKEENAANDQLDSDIEAVSNVFPTLPNNVNSPGTESHITASAKHITEKIDQSNCLKERSKEEIVSETPGREIGVVPRSLISNTKSKDETSVTLKEVTAKKKILSSSHADASKPKIANNVKTVMSHKSSLPRIATAAETAENRTEVNLRTPGTVIEKITVAKNKPKNTQRNSQERNNKPTSNEKITNAATITNAPTVTMLNATTSITTQPMQKSSNLIENNTKSSKVNKLNANNASTDVPVSSPNSINDTSKPRDANQLNAAREHTSNTKMKSNKMKTVLSVPRLSITVTGATDSVRNSPVSVSLPHSTTITPIPSMLKAGQSSAGSSNASTAVSQFSTSLSLTPNTSVNPITTSLVHKALKQQSLPQKHTSNHASVSVSATSTKSRKHSPVQNYHPPVIKSTHRRPVSPISQSQSSSQNTENVLPSNINTTPSTTRSAPKHRSNTVKVSTSLFKNTRPIPGSGYFTQSYLNRTNTTVQVQSPQTPWYPPFLVDAPTREANTLRSNVSSRNRNFNRPRINTNANTYRWHIPVEPNERTESAQRVEGRIRNVPSNQTPNQRSVDNQRVNNTPLSPNSEVGRHNLMARQSRDLNQTPRAENGRTWHTPVHEPRTHN
ncbi:uncharacterized threonine-rich GPI-anchored glycoprotein PJ4664.02-like [Leguminivora glycinivorella]|uniref:uncharacterized threonine-rich GPI-anchored glycoprotein PJ4664.02-like n=1 Tax=Leguminivora glycinivorella TaxID=1035111 RepID=UPI00200FE7EC|nr:uncharacterized threonine-rich GPI-anchored glycoprotein PJ4664.02-like [Leguminivora glycinivorella]